MVTTQEHNHTNKIKRYGNFQGDQIPEYDAILNCVRCGMCLPHCPTYTELKVERHSPRGRAALIRSVADGTLQLSDNFADAVNVCLDCRACETACPSGVRIGYLIESARSQIQQNKKQNIIVRLFRHITLCWLFQRHWRLELVALPMRIYQKTGLRNWVKKLGVLKIFPKKLRFMEELAPDGLETPLRKTIPHEVAPVSDEHARVGYFLGCMMSIMFNKTTNATVTVLTRSGCRVVTPKEIRCCGAPLMSEGFKHKAIDMMKFNIDLFEKLDVDYIITDCAACGAALKEYEEIFEHDPEYKEKAKLFSEKAREITEFLAEWPHYVGPCEPKKDETVAYDEPCHLCHAQQIWDQPKKVIQSIPGITVEKLPEADWCCGSAGIYNITHHDMAMKILDRKLDHIAKLKANTLLTANPGCMLQLGWGVRTRKMNKDVKHVVEMLVGEGESFRNRETNGSTEKCPTCGRKPRPECVNK